MSFFNFNSITQSIQSYFSFVWQHKRILCFGLLLTCLSGFGQTYYVGLYSSSIRETFGLSHSLFGLTYSLATLCSSLAISHIGKQIDNHKLQKYVTFVFILLAMACMTLYFAPSLIVLGLGLFLLRLSGQGLMSHSSITTMGKFFSLNRGKSIGIASLGYPVSEAIFPAIGSYLLGAGIFWREIWLGTAGLLILACLPLTLWLLHKHENYYPVQYSTPNGSKDSPLPHTPERNWTVNEVLKDYRFYMILPAILAPALLNTGVFFQQNHIALIKGWPQEIFSFAFSIYALTTVFASVFGGGLIDKIGATRLVWVFPIPLALGLFALGLSSHPAAIFMFMAFSGISSGLGVLMSGALWTEVYGSEHLGAIRAQVMSFIVMSTALMPYLSGQLIDWGLNFNYVLISWGAYVISGCVLANMTRLRSQ